MNPIRPLLYRVARRWIAGSTRADAIKAAEEANHRGMLAILNYLGEGLRDLADVDRALQEYEALQEEAAARGLRAHISVKPTQLGLLVSQGELELRLERLAEGARGRNQLLWIDMEQKQYVDGTLSAYRRLLEQGFSNAGVALQANLRRTERDIELLLERKPRVRLVKGAYPVRPPEGFSTRGEVSRNYERLLAMLFEGGAYVAIATHDEALVMKGVELAKRNRAGFELQFLRGIRDDLKEWALKQGHVVAEYIPYGESWYEYSMRRLRENRRNIWLLIRSLLG
jgi:proline dehydrogenase